jgi:hypothetical protein
MSEHDEQKLVNLSKEDTDSLKSIFEDTEIISDDEKKSLIQKRNKSRKDSIVFGDVFLYCYDTLSECINLFQGEDSLDERIKTYLSQFSGMTDDLRTLAENYNDSQIESFWDGEMIKDFVRSRREKMNSLIKLFFSVIGGEDV